MARAGTGPRLLRIVGVIIGALLLLLVGATLLLQTGPVSRRVKDIVVPRASAALGRELTVRDARLGIFPRPKVVLRGASVAGRPGEPPLVELQSLDVAVEAWPLIRSLGKEVRVAGIRLIRPVVNLVRAEDGTWNYQGLGKDGSQAPPEAEPGAPRSKVVVRKVSLEDGSIRLLDRLAEGGAKLAVTRIDLSADHVGLGEPFDARLSAALAGEEKNLEAEIHASRLPAGASELQPGRYPELTGKIALKGLDLARVRAFLPPRLTGVMTGGRVDADAKLEEGALTTTDLGDKVLGAVAEGLRAAGKGSAAGKVGGTAGKTELRDLAAEFTVKDGAMTLANPLTFGAPFGTASLGGKIGLGGELALQGDADIPKATLQQLAGGAGVALPAKLSVPLALGGSLMQPTVNVNAQQAVAGLVTGAAKQKVQELRQGAQDRVRREARRGLGDALKRLGR